MPLDEVLSRGEAELLAFVPTIPFFSVLNAGLSVTKTIRKRRYYPNGFSINQEGSNFTSPRSSRVVICQQVFLLPKQRENVTLLNELGGSTTYISLLLQSSRSLKKKRTNWLFFGHCWYDVVDTEFVPVAPRDSASATASIHRDFIIGYTSATSLYLVVQYFFRYWWCWSFVIVHQPPRLVLYNMFFCVVCWPPKYGSFTVESCWHN